MLLYVLAHECVHAALLEPDPNWSFIRAWLLRELHQYTDIPENKSCSPNPRWGASETIFARGISGEEGAYNEL